jgi:hypothetical protein
MTVVQPRGVIERDYDRDPLPEPVQLSDELCLQIALSIHRNSRRISHLGRVAQETGGFLTLRQRIAIF